MKPVLKKVFSVSSASPARAKLLLIAISVFASVIGGCQLRRISITGRDGGREASVTIQFGTNTFTNRNVVSPATNGFIIHSGGE